jgi:glycosyltransferase involved in cell wall biosynthesis
MRIVYILTSLGMGGAERQVLALGDRMALRGHAVALLVLRPRLDEEWTTQIGVFRLDMRKTPLSVIRAILRGRRFLREFRPDIVHSHGFHGNMMARLLHLVGTAPSPITTIHNVYEGGRVRMTAYRLTDRLSRLTTAVSAAAAERFVRMKAVPAHKCVVLSNGIDTAEFAPDSDRRALTRAKMGVSDEFVWLAAGRIVPAKDFPNLLRAFAQVRSQVEAGCPRSVGSDLGKKTQLWIAGEATGPESAGLRALIAELDLSGQVRILGLRRDLPALLDASDGFALGSAWEGMPLAIGEAMAMEKAVVVTDVGGTRELVGDAGLLVPARDANALAQAMLRVMRMSPEERRALGRAARLRIAQSFSIDARTAEWEALYASISKN